MNEYSEIDILEQAGASEDVLAEVAPERKELPSRGINISQIDEVYVKGKEAIAIGPANRERFQWYYLQKRAGSGRFVPPESEATYPLTVRGGFSGSRA